MSPVGAVGAASFHAVRARIEQLEQRLGVWRPASAAPLGGAATDAGSAASGRTAPAPAADSFGATLDGVLAGSGDELVTAVTELLGIDTPFPSATAVALPGPTATIARPVVSAGTAPADVAFDAAVARLRAGWGTPVSTVPVGAPVAGAPAAAMATATGVPGIDGPVSPSTPYAHLFEEAGARHGIPPKVLAAVGWVESRFQLDAVSSAGAVGMMQFLPSTAAGMGVDPYDPVSAIDGAARYLRHALDRFGSLEQAIAAYNVGPGTIARAGGVQPGTQAERYLQKVLDATGRV